MSETVASTGADPGARPDAAGGGRTTVGPKVGVAIVTRDRRERLIDVVDRLRQLPERPPIAVADNGSDDGTVTVLRERYPPPTADGGDPGVAVVALGRNIGCAARTVAARTLATPYVAFCDDDGWWEAGALARAAAHFDADPRLGLLAAQVVVGPDRRIDPTCVAMTASPLAADGGAGRPVLGFVACGAVARRRALLAVEAFPARYGIGGEETLLALDLVAAGWRVRYLPDVVACHWPETRAHGAGRELAMVRNDLWTIWLRRPARRLPAATARRLAAADAGTAVRATAAALRSLPWVVRSRRPLPAAVERAVRSLEHAEKFPRAV